MKKEIEKYVPIVFEVSKNVDTNQDHYRYREPENKTVQKKT
jgi:hypothetical protein